MHSLKSVLSCTSARSGLAALFAVVALGATGCAADADGDDDNADLASVEGAEAGDEESVGTDEAAVSTGAPSCVTWAATKAYVFDSPGGYYVYVTNRCSNTVRVRMDIAHGPDTACRKIEPRQRTLYVMAGFRYRNIRKVALCK